MIFETVNDVHSVQTKLNDFYIKIHTETKKTSSL